VKIQIAKTGQAKQGYVLLLTISFGAVTLAVLAGALSWSVNNMRANSRSNQYFRTVAAAEAATEAVITRLESDYQTGSDALVQANLASYRLVVPSSSDNSLWANYVFGNDLGQSAQCQVVFLPPASFRQLSAQYTGLQGYVSAYQITSDARELNAPFALTMGVQQNVETATIPLFQFAIFYNVDLEINPGPDMTISGPVHSNGILYTQPQATLTFQGDVTSVGAQVVGAKPGDPTARTLGTIVFQGEHDGGVSSLAVPIGTNNTPSAVRQVVEMPPAGELTT
jgi:hypothetical protein